MNTFERARYNAGLRIKDAAKTSNVHERTIRRLEDGSIEKPSAPVAKALADVYGITIEQLLGLPADPPAEAEPRAVA